MQTDIDIAKQNSAELNLGCTMIRKYYDDGSTCEGLMLKGYRCIAGVIGRLTIWYQKAHQIPRYIIDADEISNIVCGKIIDMLANGEKAKDITCAVAYTLTKNSILNALFTHLEIPDKHTFNQIMHIRRYAKLYNIPVTQDNAYKFSRLISRDIKEAQIGHILSSLPYADIVSHIYCKDAMHTYYKEHLNEED